MNASCSDNPHFIMILSGFAFWARITRIFSACWQIFTRFSSSDNVASSMIDDSELGKFHQQLLGAGIAEYDGGLQVLPHSLQFDDLADTEIIPWKEDQELYLAKNVAPYAPDYHVDESKTRIGYEIPFTREFYRYTPLKPSGEIFQTLKELEQKESELMERLLH